MKQKKLSFRLLLTLLVCLPLLLTVVILTVPSSTETKSELTQQYLATLDDANMMMFKRTKKGSGVEDLSHDEGTGLNKEDATTSLDESFDEHKKDTGIDCILHRFLWNK